MVWQSLLYCPGRRSRVDMYADRPMHAGATENDQKEHYDVLEFDHRATREELETAREQSQCPGCGLPYPNVHDAQEVPA